MFTAQKPNHICILGSVQYTRHSVRIVGRVEFENVCNILIQNAFNFTRISTNILNTDAYTSVTVAVLFPIHMRRAEMLA